MTDKSDEKKREERIKQLLRQVEEDIKETQAKLFDPQCSPESKEKLKENLKVFEDAKKLFKSGRWYPGAPGQHWKIKNGKWIHFDDDEWSQEIRREWIELIEFWEKTAAEKSTDPKVSPEKLERIKQGIKKWIEVKKEIKNGLVPSERPARGWRRGEDGEWRASTDEESDELEASFIDPENDWQITPDEREFSEEDVIRALEKEDVIDNAEDFDSLTMDSTGDDDDDDDEEIEEKFEEKSFLSSSIKKATWIGFGAIFVIGGIYLNNLNKRNSADPKLLCARLASDVVARNEHSDKYKGFLDRFVQLNKSEQMAHLERARALDEEDKEFRTKAMDSLAEVVIASGEDEEEVREARKYVVGGEYYPVPTEDADALAKFHEAIFWEGFFSIYRSKTNVFCEAYGVDLNELYGKAKTPAGIKFQIK